jgi:hypothetical protein
MVEAGIGAGRDSTEARLVDDVEDADLRHGDDESNGGTERRRDVRRLGAREP